MKIRLTGSYKDYYGFSISSISPIDYSYLGSIVKSGTCGNNLTYQLDDSGTLLISGTGYMDSYAYSFSPWHFQTSKIKRVVVEGGVTSIGAYAFEDCANLESVKIASSVYSIYENAFSGCTKLNNITIPQGVENIYENAFYGCTNLLGIVLPDGMSKIGRHAFENTYYYNHDSNWSYPWLAINTYIIKAKSTITGIDHSYFEPYDAIADGAFENCDELVYVAIPYSLSRIGDWAFYGCDKLQTMYHTSFYRMSTSSLYEAHINIPARINSELEYIGKHAFSLCPSLSRVDIPVGVKVIGDYAFQDSNNIAIVNYNGDDTDWNAIDIGSLYNANKSLLSAKRNNVTMVVFYIYDGRYNVNFHTIPTNSVIPDDIIPKYTGYTTTYFEDIEKTNPFDFSKPVNKNTVIYLNKKINQYTYKFLDDNGDVIKEETANYNTKIVKPENPADKDPYTFDYWDGYTSNMSLTDNISFTAKYKHKKYKIVIPDKNKEMSVVYNDNFAIEPASRPDCVFKGYYTEINGCVERITDEEGNSLQGYHFLTDITAYPYFEHSFLNDVKFEGTTTVDIGDQNVLQNLLFATNKEAKYFSCTLKVPNSLAIQEIKSDVFEIEQDLEVIGNDTYYYLFLIYNGDGIIPTHHTINALEILFDISENAVADEILTLEVLADAILADDNGNLYDFADIGKAEIKINPIFAEEITIVGADEIDAPTQYTVSVLPENTTNSNVEWSVSDEAVATISEDGLLTPVKKGSVTIKATAKDESGVYAEKTVSVKVLGTVNSISTNIGVWGREYSPDTTNYTIYVPENTTSIRLTALHSGKLKADGTTFVNNVTRTVTLSKESDKTVLDLSYTCEGYDDNKYTITIIKFEGTKREVSEDKKSFTITPINIENGKTVVLALYNGEQFVEMQSDVYTGDAIPFTTTKTYTKAKVMVWDDLINLKPVCEVETIE